MKSKNIINKFILSKIIILISIPILIIMWIIILKDEHIEILLIILSVLVCLPILINFEHKKHSNKEYVLISIMLALSISSRFIFIAFPAFKPITALIIITGIYLGYESGVIVGCMTPLLSNMYFMQGIWTPMQMIIWGVIGLTAGIMYKKLKTSKVTLCIFGVISGIVYSMFMDLWSTIWYDGYFNLERYITIVITSLPVMIEYSISNVIFLLVLCKPIGSKIERIKVKYKY